MKPVPDPAGLIQAPTQTRVLRGKVLGLRYELGIRFGELLPALPSRLPPRLPSSPEEEPQDALGRWESEGGLIG